MWPLCDNECWVCRLSTGQRDTVSAWTGVRGLKCWCEGSHIFIGLALPEATFRGKLVNIMCQHLLGLCSRIERGLATLHIQLPFDN